MGIPNPTYPPAKKTTKAPPSSDNFEGPAFLRKRREHRLNSISVEKQEEKNSKDNAKEVSSSSEESEDEKPKIRNLRTNLKKKGGALKAGGLRTANIQSFEDAKKSNEKAEVLAKEAEKEKIAAAKIEQEKEEQK